MEKYKLIKYLYVLTSDETDYYLEQAFLSIASLKMRMPYAFVSLLIDDVTEKTLTDKRRNILDIVNELKSIEIDSKFNKKERSRWLKTSMRHHIEGDFLYIDCDTVICDILDDVVKLDVDLGAVLDSHVLLSNHIWEKGIRDNDKLLKFNDELTTDKFFNSGVIFCKDVQLCHNFFNEWHKLWIRSASITILDQPTFYRANLYCNNIIKEINGIWNCQIYAGGIMFLANAKIIHYFSSNKSNTAYIPADMLILQSIRELGTIDSTIKNILTSPKTSFQPNITLIFDLKTLLLINSVEFLIIKKIYECKYIKYIYKIMKFIFVKLKRILT